MKQFKLVDNMLGWLSFLIAAIVYCSTIEPTASFWDCPEFITTGYKLEIGHRRHVFCFYSGASHILRGSCLSAIGMS